MSTLSTKTEYRLLTKRNRALPVGDLIRRLCGAFVLLWTGNAAYAAGRPTLDLVELVTGADVIVVGQVEGIRETSRGTLEINGNRLESAVLEGYIVVADVLKGSPLPERIPLSFTFPITPAGGVGYRGIPDRSFRLVFLKRSARGFDFVSPYYPSFPAVRGFVSPGGNTIDQVLHQLAAALDSPQIPRDDRLQLLFDLRGSNSQILTSALRNALRMTKDELLQLSIAAALLQRNDISALDIAKDALIHPKRDVPPYVLENLSSAISAGVTDQRAIPALAEIVKNAPQAYSRRSATFALRGTASNRAVPPLLVALGDKDFEVRYYAVIGLAEITNNVEWRPLEEDFRLHEQRYLTFWREWAAAR